MQLVNYDNVLVSFKSGWISCRDEVGHVFGNYLKWFHESGIYPVWQKRSQKFSDALGLRAIQDEIRKYNGGRPAMSMRSEKDKPFSLTHLAMHFALIAVG